MDHAFAIRRTAARIERRAPAFATLLAAVSILVFLAPNVSGPEPLGRAGVLLLILAALTTGSITVYQARMFYCSVRSVRRQKNAK
jgi:hypothetical protein